MSIAIENQARQTVTILGEQIAALKSLIKARTDTHAVSIESQTMSTDLTPPPEHWEDLTPEAAAQHGYTIPPGSTVADFRAAGWMDDQLVECGIIRGPVPAPVAPKAHPLTTDQLEYIKKCQHDIFRMIESLGAIDKATGHAILHCVLIDAEELRDSLAKVTV